MARSEHHSHDATATAAAIAVVTVSDTRTRETDGSGAAIRSLAGAAGHRIAAHEIVPDDPRRVAAIVSELVTREDVDAVITNGGTGLSPRDRTCEAVAGLLDRRIDGFGELFRSLSYEQIGPAAMLSRAVAGVVSGKVVFTLPGSEAAVRLGMEKLILPEIGHILSELRKDA